ncbi:MAG: hypothetical protein CVU43_07130 [Chloroflexi bacterium HGW-Chloroflexi-5]|nr:MAG: hypothetical protein CVU43_07130 [Chloroflexi bacterium HGW-Chloroflexi-5]
MQKLLLSLKRWLRKQDQSDRIIPWTAEGVHEIVLGLANEVIPNNGILLDLGCGPGALTEKLFSKGYNVIAVDGFSEVFQLHDKVKFIELNLEEDWGSLGINYDCIFAVEIIEHLENPYLFIRKCYSLLKPGGYLICTTPNAGHYISRIMFLTSGVFSLYSPKSFNSTTATTLNRKLPPHKNLFTSWMLKGNLSEAGFMDMQFYPSTNFLTGLKPIPLRPLNLLKWVYFQMIGIVNLLIIHSSPDENIFSKNLIFHAKKPL